MITQVEGNLITRIKENHYTVAAHGCNCFNFMAGGIALQVANTWNEPKEADNRTSPGDESKLGSFTMSLIRRPNYKVDLFNLYTQYRPGKCFDNEAFIKAYKSMIKYCYPGDKVGIPQIGCGIAGGKWEVVEDYIKHNTPSHINVEIVIFNGD